MAQGDDTRAVGDEEWMSRAAAGDVGAFGQIYDRHAPSVLALLRRLLGATGDEQDLLHDVFMEAWLAARSYDPGRASVRGWLLVRARSRALDRRARSARQRLAHVSLSHSAERQTTPETERQLAVRQALATLDADVRQTLELRFFEGMTAPQVAAAMDVPEGTVKSRLARGLEIMQRVLRLLEEKKS